MGTEPFVELLVRANLALAAGIALVLVLRAPARRLFGARAAYALWLLPLAAAAMCFAPARVEHVVIDASFAGLPSAPSAPQPPYLLWAWGAGAVLSLIVLALRQARFTRALGRLSDLGDGVRGAESAAHGPAVIGVLRPVIVTPADFDNRFDAEERRIVLAHERAHLAQGDPWINAGVVLLQCVNWFNPLVHIGARALRIDQELACDAAVLAQTDGLRRRYAETILKTHIAQAAPIGCAWPPSSLNDIKERLAMLKRNLPSRAQRLAGVSVVALAVAGVAAAAWAAQPTRVVATFAAPALLATQDSDGQLAGGEDCEHEHDDDCDHDHDHDYERLRTTGLDRELTPEEREELEEALHEMHEALSEMHVNLAQAQAAMATVDHGAIARAVAEAMEESREERLEAIREAQIEMAHLQAEMANRPEFQAEMREAMRQAELELAREMPRINEETRLAIREAMADVERQMAVEMPRIREEIRVALREAESEMVRERDEARARGDREEAAELDRALRHLRRERERNERESNP